MVRILSALCLCLCALAAQAKVSASIDKNPALIGETIVLTVRTEGGGGDPELAVLEQDFQILGTSSSSQFQIINGKTQRSHDWIVQLRPKRLGEITIPAIRVGSEATSPLKIQVVEPQRAPGESPEAFIEFEADKSSAYVREQVLLSVRLFVRGDLVSGSLSEPQSNAAVIEQIGEQTESQQLRGAQRYRVIERHYALFAESSGDLELAGPIFNGEISSGQQRRTLFGYSAGTRAIYAAGEPLRFAIKVQPSEAGSDFWLPASGVILQDALSPASGPYKAGDPLTRTVTLRVRGQLHTQLPDLEIPSPAGTQTYTEAPQDKTMASSSEGLIAERVYSVAVIPGEGGILQLPELRLNWWDTRRDQLQTATLPARTLNIEAIARPQAATEPPIPAQAPTALPENPPVAPANTAAVWPWQVATLAAIAGWIGTLLAWWWQARRPHRSTDAPEAPDPIKTRRVLQSLKSDAPREARQALMEWARQSIGPVTGLLALSHYANSNRVDAALKQLDAAAFGIGGPFDREALIDFVKGFRNKTTPPRASALPPLYPEHSS